MSRPSNQIRPAVGRISPEISRKNVVLPAPLGPMIERSSPRRSVTFTRSTASKLPNARVSCSVRSRTSSDMATYATRGCVGASTSSLLRPHGADDLPELATQGPAGERREQHERGEGHEDRGDRALEED